MLETLLTYLVKNGQAISITTYMLVDIIVHGVAFYNEWLVLGKAYHRLMVECASQETTLATVNEKLIDQRLLNERATVTIETLKDHVRELELDIARAEGQPRPRRARPT